MTGLTIQSYLRDKGHDDAEEASAAECMMPCLALSLELRGAFEVFISHGSTLFTQLPGMVASAGRLLWEVPVFHQQLGEM